MTGCCRIYFFFSWISKACEWESRAANGGPEPGMLLQIFTEIHSVGFIPPWWDAFYGIEPYFELFPGNFFSPNLTWLYLKSVLICASIGEKKITFLGWSGELTLTLLMKRYKWHYKQVREEFLWGFCPCLFHIYTNISLNFT